MTTSHLVRSLLLLSTLLCSQDALGQTATINTYAGNDALFAGAGLAATSAQLVTPSYFAVDGQGNVYFSDPGYSMVLKVSTNGVISIVAGNGLPTGGGDGGLAIGASLGKPEGLAFDSSGNLYIADWAASNVRKVDTNGIITTVASGLGNPVGIAIDRSGNLYVAEYSGNRIVMVAASTGIVSTIAGAGPTGFSGDGGPATQATFTYPTGIAVDSSGNVYVSDTYNSAIRKISNGIITTVAGSSQGGFGGDGGQATSAKLSAPQGVTVDASGNMFIADTGNERIRRVDPSGVITTIAGSGTVGFGGDGSVATAAMLDDPVGVAVDASGAVYVADMANNRVRRFLQGGNIATFAGTAFLIGDGGPSTQARLDNPGSVAVDSSGNLYIADPGANRVRKVTPSGTITTVAGNGAAAYSGDSGPGSAAALNNPDGVAVDSAGNLYIADSGNHRIRRVDASTGIITTFAGNGGCCYTGPGTDGDGGLATAATLSGTTSVATDGLGNVYLVAMVSNSKTVVPRAVRRITKDGKIDIWAGGAPVVGFAGDGGSPLQAEFGYDIRIAGAPDGSLYIADPFNNRVRKIDPAGTTITTVAGTGSSTYSGDGGTATSAGVPGPWSVLVDAAGNLYIGNKPSVRKVSPSGIISLYAGGQYGFSGDGGPATAAAMTEIDGLALDSANNLYLADTVNRRIRQVQPAVSPAIALSSTSLDFKLAATGSTPTTQTFVVSNSGQGTLNWAAAATTTSGGAWLSVSPANGNTLAGQAGTTVTVTASPSGLAAGDYYGLIQVSSPNASSQFQVVTVRFTIQTAGEDPPQIFVGGIVSAASYKGPVAPGTLVAIYGSNFTDSSLLLADALPWPNELGGTSVTIAGVTAPVFVVTPGQINAMLPFGLAVNTDLPVVVTRNNAVSAPQSVSMVSALPSVFTQNQTGQGLGAIIILHPDGSWNLAGVNSPAKAGDTLEIYCTGLGDTNPRTVAGFPATASPLLWAIDTVTLTVGGVNVPASYYGLVPGLAGLFQVNATLPSGITPSSQSPVVLSQGGRAGVTVTIPTQ